MKRTIVVLISLVMILSAFTTVKADTPTNAFYGFEPTDESIIQDALVNLSDSADMVSARTVLPNSVDNSSSIYFPPIGNQGNQGSCTAWASTYYAFTYYANKLHNTSAAMAANQSSPAWTYNFLTETGSDGLTYNETYCFLRNHGTVSMQTLPYNQNNFTAFPSESAIFGALNTRLKTYSSAVINTKTASYTESTYFQWVKEQLANGEILLVQFVCSSGAANCDDVTLSNGDNLVYQVNTTEGGHAVTIVGYNDSICYDINGNGRIDSGESGAFKVVNSWGTNSTFSPGGYYWVLYDALNYTSEISGDWNTKANTRNAAFAQSNNSGSNVFWKIVVEDYEPTVIAKVKINGSKGDYIELFGVGDSESLIGYDRVWYPFAGTSTLALNTTIYLDYSKYANNIDNYTVGKYWLFDFCITPSLAQLVDSKGVVLASFNNQKIHGHSYSCTINYSRGDVNYDGAITQEDADAVFDYVMGYESYSHLQKYLADFNEDGAVTTADVRALLLLLN